MMFLRKFSLPFALESSSWMISTRFSFWSLVNKRGTNFALTRRPLKFFSKNLMTRSYADAHFVSNFSRTVKRRFLRITARTLSTWWSFVDVESSSRPGTFTDRHSALFKRLNHSQHCVRLIQSSPYAWLSKWNVSVKFLPSVQQTFTHTRSSSSSFIVTLSLILGTACARGQFSWCSSTTNAHSETGQMAVCCQNLTLGALSSRSALSVLVGALFTTFGLFLNMPRI